MTLPRMRTAAGVLEIIKEQDPDTEVTMHYLRHLINTNQVPVTPVGCKKLVNVDTVIAFIAAGQAPPAQEEECETVGRIRRVPV